MDEQNYGQNTPSTQSNGLSIAALVLGICAVVFVFIYLIVGVVLAIVGLVLSIIARKQNPSGMATAGLVLNIVALSLCVIVFLACTACIATVLPQI